MAFFFGRKLDVAKEYSLTEIPVFSSLNPSEQRLIEKKARLVEFKKGDLIYHEGTPSDAFYVVVSGQFRLFNKSRNDPRGETLIYFYRGDHFGETSLLTSRAHSGSVECERDGIILKLEKEDFLKLVSEIPAISLYLSRSLGHRLTKSQDATKRREVKIVSLYAKVQTLPTLELWFDFADKLAQLSQRKAVLVDFNDITDPIIKHLLKREISQTYDLLNADPSKDGELDKSIIDHGRNFHYLPVSSNGRNDIDEKKVATLISFLTYRYDYLFLRLPSQINPIAFRALKQSDRVYVYSDSNPTDLSLCSEILGELQQTFGFGPNEIQMMVPLEEPVDPILHAEKEGILKFKIFSLIPSKATCSQRYEGVIRYLAKEMAGTLVGLALGSGAAFGLAHIGVIKVLEQEGIPIDVITGCSIGALIGGFYASGYSIEELEKVAHAFSSKAGLLKIIGPQDFSIAHRGFFKGNQVLKFFEDHLGQKTFQDMKIPLKIIAADLITSEQVVLDSGRVADAIRASSSIPGIFRPFKHQGRYLIDGGVVDPLPVKTLVNMGVKKIIAVNVLAGPKDRIERNRVREEIRKMEREKLAQKNAFEQMWVKGMDKVSERYAVNIFNVIMSTIQFMEYEMAELWARHADVVIHPIVQEAHWAEFYSPEKFINAGEARTREVIADLKKLV